MLFLILSGQSIYSQDKDPDKSYYGQPARFETVTAGQAMGDSLMLPGLGHYKTGNYGWGHFYTLAFLFGLINLNEKHTALANPPSYFEYVGFGGLVIEMQWQQNDLVKLFYYGYIKREEKIHNLKEGKTEAINLIAILYFIQAGHAWFSGKKYDPVESWSLSVIPGSQAQASIGFTYRF